MSSGTNRDPGTSGLRGSWAVLCAAGILGLAGAATAARADDAPSLKGSGEVIVTSGGGTWEDAQRKAFFEPFERETGIKVVLVPEDHSKLLTSVEAGVTEADLTSINAGQLAGFKGRKAVVPIDYKFFSKATLAGMPDVLKNEYGVGANYYAIGIAYNTDRFPADKAPKNWVDYYDTAKFPGPRGMANCEKIIDGGMLEAALMGDGVPPEKVYPIDMDRAFKKIEAIKPQVKKWWVAGAEAPQGLIDGELDISSAYNGRIFAAKKLGAPLRFSWDQSLLQYDYWVAMKGGPNHENAMKFLAFISKPEQQAIFVNAIGYGPINNDTYKLLDPKLIAEVPGSPETAKKMLLQNYDWWTSTNGTGKTNWDTAVERCVKMLAR
jgi:putative spermidine/putrescine transport system substrate-binding protein